MTATQRGAVPVPAPVERDAFWQVAADTWCLRMPIDLPVRYTHCYLLLGGDRVLVVDPGWDAPCALERILDALQRIGHEPRSIAGVLATHAHRDHVGLAHELAELAGEGCWVGMHVDELDDHRGAETIPAWRDREMIWLEALGVPPEEWLDALIPEEGVDSILRTTRADRALSDGDWIEFAGRAVAVVHTPGHSPGSICLIDVDRRLILTGDTLLPRISPNVGWAPHGRDDPLGDYLSSLDRLAPYDEWTALPGHEWPFTGLRMRTDFLREHHEERDAEILGALDDDTPWSLATRLTWSRTWGALDGFQRRIAAAETAAHLRRLVSLGVVDHPGGNRYRRPVETAPNAPSGALTADRHHPVTDEPRREC